MDNLAIKMIEDIQKSKLQDDYTKLAAHSLTGRHMLMDLGMSQEDAEKTVAKWDREVREIVLNAAKAQFD